MAAERYTWDRDRDAGGCGGYEFTAALEEGVELEIAEGAVLRAVVDESAYPSIWTRVAGIEMEWHSALLNVCGQSDVRIGIINSGITQI
jgi:hypothetical protein